MFARLDCAQRPQKLKQRVAAAIHSTAACEESERHSGHRYLLLRACPCPCRHKLALGTRPCAASAPLSDVAIAAALGHRTCGGETKEEARSREGKETRHSEARSTLTIHAAAALLQTTPLLLPRFLSLSLLSPSSSCGSFTHTRAAHHARPRKLQPRTQQTHKPHSQFCRR